MKQRRPSRTPRPVVSRKEIGKRLKMVGAGCECDVYGFSDKLVLKTYVSGWERDSAFESQKQACVAGIAPPTRGRMDYGRRFGYLSCVAVVDNDLPGAKRVGNHGGLVKRLQLKMQDLGFRILDLHSGNIGRYNGKPVVIDFGLLTTGPTESQS